MTRRYKAPKPAPLHPSLAAFQVRLKQAEAVVEGIEDEQEEMVREFVLANPPEQDPHCEPWEIEYILLGWQSCTKSGLGLCVYDDMNDTCHDNCLYCHEPAERK